jgi:hypothetical protein
VPVRTEAAPTEEDSMTDNGIVWEEPKPDKRGSESWAERLRPLMEHPDRWARVGEVNRSSAWAVARQLTSGIKQHPPGRWEFAARGSDDKPSRGYIYARYLGPEDGGS